MSSELHLQIHSSDVNLLLDIAVYFQTKVINPPVSLPANTLERAWAEFTSLLPANQPFSLLLRFVPDTIIPVCPVISLSAGTNVFGINL
jgi:hypothetical protein